MLDFLNGDLMHSPSGDQRLIGGVSFTNFPSDHVLTLSTVRMLQIALNCHVGQVVKGSTKSPEQLPRGWLVLGPGQGGEAT